MRNTRVNEKDRLNGVRELLLIQKRQVKRRKSLTFSERERRIVSPIYSAAAILPIAYFEISVETIILRFIDEININSYAIEWTKLPQKIRKLHLENAILKLTNLKENKNISSEDMKDAIRCIINDVTQPDIVNNYKCDIEEILKSKSNYNESRINDLFNSIGLKDIFSRVYKLKLINLLSRELIRDKLKELCDRRDMAAHGIDILNANITFQSMEEGIDFIDNLSESLILILEDYLSRIKKVSSI
ncbi:MAG: hypothetical protein EG826_00765 [Deltaproteobacteria bacterium]|nr:hypothetical protein [Deltaproteobacteria bacterium]